MVKIKDKEHVLADGSVDLERWLQHLADKQKLTDLQLVRNACMLSQLAGSEQPTETGESCLQQGLAMAEILSDLELDSITLAAAIVYESVQYADLSLEDVREHLGDQVAKLVDGVTRMNTLSVLRRSRQNNPDRFGSQTDNLRRMLIAMVDNVQVVLIKLAERIRVLRNANHLTENQQRDLAQETMDIYAPLANRLGIGQIKWELEDLAFRYLEPQIYKTIAKGLKSRRIDRDRCINEIVDMLTKAVTATGIHNAKIYGRSKHIFSIYRKMQRKNVDINEIYDAHAVRVLVDTVEDCYTVLGIVHNQWKQISHEFDDYINNPKENGYRSLHTAVIGPEGLVFEVQIRSYEMHDQAELGVAAHWLYKEGGQFLKSGHERKIAWLRQVLDWQKEITHQTGNDDYIDIHSLEDRIYVFTPAGDIADLAHGSTPLDFAYHIHSDIGHRCRGAKVDGNIVPLTYKLKTGEQVSILTTKVPKPSRDWINPQLGYLHSARSKAKVLQWFKQQDYEKHRQEGQQAFERELKKQNIPLHTVNHDKFATQMHFKSSADFFAALGRGDIRHTLLTQTMQTFFTPTVSTPAEPATASRSLINTPAPNTTRRKSEITVQGVDNLLSRFAHCCKPIPGDPIVGYVTQGQGVSIHRRDCTNIMRLDPEKQERLLEVNWGQISQHTYPVDISIVAQDKPGLIRDISTLVASEKINVMSFSTRTDIAKQRAYLQLTLAIQDLNVLRQILLRLQQLPDIVDVKRLK